MSKIAKKVINLEGLTYNLSESNLFTVKFGKNENSLQIPETVKLIIEGNKLFTKSDMENNAICGTINRLIDNMIMGLKTPFKKIVKLSGIGFKGVVQGNDIVLNVGCSHTISVPIPNGVSVVFNTASQMTLTSICKQKVGAFSSELARKYRPHNVYSGKGILEEGVFYNRKETKRK